MDVAYTEGPCLWEDVCLGKLVNAREKPQTLVRFIFKIGSTKCEPNNLICIVYEDQKV